MAVAIFEEGVICIRKNNSNKTKDNKILLKPKYDVVFQSLFSDKNREETSYFISAILGRKVHVLKVNTEVSQVREYPEEKIGRMDLIAYTEEGETIHIEVQLVDSYNTASRLLYSLCQNVSKQLNRGEDYKEISKTITIGLLDYNMQELKDLNQMHTIWRLQEESNEKVLTKLVEIHIIEMKRAKYEYEKDHNNILAKWILFILDPNMREVKSIMNENEEIKKTAEKLETLNDDENVRKRAEILARWEMEEKWNKASIEKHFDELYNQKHKQYYDKYYDKYYKQYYGKQFEEKVKKLDEKLEKEARKKVEKKLREKIEEEVKKKAEEESRKEEKIEIAEKMLKNSIDKETVSKIIGLSKEEIEGLEKKSRQ